MYGRGGGYGAPPFMPRGGYVYFRYLQRASANLSIAIEEDIVVAGVATTLIEPKPFISPAV